MRRLLVILLLAIMLSQTAMPAAAALATTEADGGPAAAAATANLSNLYGTFKEAQAGPSPVPMERGPRAIPLAYDDVLLVYNENSQMSVDIANYFLSKRPIPQTNVCNISTSTAETVDRTTFTNQIRRPVESCIVDGGLEDTINYIVTTKGVPLRVTGANAAVDAELALILGHLNSSIGNSGWVNSPFFGEDKEFTHEEYGIYIVTRLTAFTLEEVKGIIDLADNSTGSRGLYVLDEGAKGGGYAAGDDWLSDANETLTEKGEDVYHDVSGTFQMHQKDVLGYGSWGSNDGNFYSNYLPNSGFETDGNSDGLPDGWTTVDDGGTWSRSSDTSQSGTYSAKIVRPSTTAGDSEMGYVFDILPDTRYYTTGYANLSGISADSGAYMFVKALDASSNVVLQYNTSRYTGDRNWFGLPQIKYEPQPGVSRVMVGVAVSQSSGTAYFDALTFRLIKPNNTYVPGAIGETYVSTGGRSFNYATGYGQSLVADLIREGMSGISGHVFEPYLTACGRPNILFDRYSSGYTMGESYYMALPFVGWMEVVVGDPKMIPYYDVPDAVVIDNMTVSPAEPAVGEEVTVTGWVHNRGGPIATIGAQFYLGNPDLDDKLGAPITISNLARGETRMYQVKHTFTETGFERVYLAVDKASLVKESKENNNQANINILIDDRPDLEVTEEDIVFSEEEALQGDIVHLTVDARNIGGVPTKMTATVDINGPGGYSDVHQVVVDPVNGSMEVNVLDIDIDTATISGVLCANVTLATDRVEESLDNNEAGVCIFVQTTGYGAVALTDLLEAPPFGYAEHMFNVTNNGNIDDTISFATEVSDVLWTVLLQPNEVTLGQDETTTVYLRTYPGTTSRYLDELEVNVTITSSNTAVITYLEFTSVMGPRFETALEVETTEFEVLPGEAKEVPMSIGNLGNTADDLTIIATEPGDWTATFDTDEATLATGGYLDVILTVTAPVEALAGSIAVIEVNLLSANGAANDSVPLYFQVLQVFNISVDANITETVVLSDPTPFEGTVMVTNLGNGPDTIALEASAKGGLAVQLATKTVNLDPGPTGTTTVGIQVTASPTVAAGNYTVTVSAMGKGGEEVKDTFEVKVLRPDIVIAFSATPDGSAKSGSKVKFSIEVWNEGDAQTSAFDVTMSVGGVQKGKETVSALTGSDHYTMTFEWQASPGSWQFVFNADSADIVQESDEDNNRLVHTLVVKKEGGGGGAGGAIIEPWLLAVIIVAIVVLYLVAKIGLWSRRLKTAAKEGEDRRARDRRQEEERRWKEGAPEDDGSMEPGPPTIPPAPVMGGKAVEEGPVDEVTEAEEEEAEAPAEPTEEEAEAPEETPEEEPEETPEEATEEAPPEEASAEEAPKEEAEGPAEEPTEEKPEAGPPAAPTEEPKAERSELDDLMEMLKKS